MRKRMRTARLLNRSTANVGRTLVCPRNGDRLKSVPRFSIWLYLQLVLLLFVVLPVAAQTPVTSRYIYDQNGRLRAVITPEGAAVYDYDPAGNFTAIRRLAPNACEAIEFTPRQGPPGTPVTIYAIGFNEQVSVTFNGTPATITGRTATSVTANVPDRATSGALAVSLTCGTKTFSTPFTVSGVRVLPAVATVAPTRDIQFAAMVAGVVDPGVKWSVNQVDGGNSSLGTITETGLYTSPLLPPNSTTTQFLIRATSLVEPSIFGEAIVKVTGSGYEFLAQGVSVRYGTPANVAVAYVAIPVSVRYETPAPKPSGYVNGAVSVRYGSQIDPPSGYVTSPISVRYGVPANPSPGYVKGAVSVRYGDPVTPTLVSPISIVSVTKGPSLTSLSSSILAKGATVTLTIKGVNLTGVARIEVITPDGAVDSGITVSEINVNSTGTTLKAKVSVKRDAGTGRRVIRVLTAEENSQVSSASSNTIEIIP